MRIVLNKKWKAAIETGGPVIDKKNNFANIGIKSMSIDGQNVDYPFYDAPHTYVFKYNSQGEYFLHISDTLMNEVLKMWNEFEGTLPTDISIQVDNDKAVKELENLKAEAWMQIAAAEHIRNTERWEEGDPVSAWYDGAGNLCVEYESGKWWHYKDLDMPFPSWW